MRSLVPWPKTPFSQVMSPTSLTTSTTQSSDAVPSYLFHAELDDETIGRALRRQAYHSYEESLLPAQSFSVCHSRTVRPVHELNSLSSCSKEKPSREMENETIRILLERQKEQILANFRAEIQKHEIQADSDRRNIQELNGIIESQRREIDHALTGDEQLRRDQQLLHEQNRELREAHKNWSDSRVYIRYIFEKKINRRSRHYLWTHSQNSGTSEWS